MALKLHRCGTPWKFGPCWRVQKALDDQRVLMSWCGAVASEGTSRRDRGAGQPLFPAIQFEDGGWYREESKDMARTIRERRLREKELGGVPGS